MTRRIVPTRPPFRNDPSGPLMPRKAAAPCPPAFPWPGPQHEMCRTGSRKATRKQASGKPKASGWIGENLKRPGEGEAERREETLVSAAEVRVVSERPRRRSQIGPRVGVVSLREPGANILRFRETFRQPSRERVQPIYGLVAWRFGLVHSPTAFSCDRAG